MSSSNSSGFSRGGSGTDEFVESSFQELRLEALSESEARVWDSLPSPPSLLTAQGLAAVTMP